MAMVLTRALGSLSGIMRGEGIANDILAFGYGVASGYLMQKTDWYVWWTLLGNIALVVAYYLGLPIPKGIVHSAEYMIGLDIGILLA